MCEICRQTICPSGCPNAPLDAPPPLCLCGKRATYRVDGLPLCKDDAMKTVNCVSLYSDKVDYVLDDIPHFFQYLKEFGKIGREELYSTTFNWTAQVTDYCDETNDDYFEWLLATGREIKCEVIEDG